MPDCQQDSPNNNDRKDWDRAWKTMPHRRLAAPPWSGLECAAIPDPVSWTLALAPLRFSGRLFFASEHCPICGATTAGTERLPANLSTIAANGLSLGAGVWVHRACFDQCPETNTPAPIPW